MRVAIILFIFSSTAPLTFLKGEIKEAVERGRWVIGKVKNDPLTSVLTLPEKIGGRLDTAFRIRKTSSLAGSKMLGQGHSGDKVTVSVVKSRALTPLTAPQYFL